MMMMLRCGNDEMGPLVYVDVVLMMERYRNTARINFAG